MPVADFLQDLFEPVGRVTFRRMFGGEGVFRDGLMFGLVSDDILYFKADALTAARFDAEGCGPFVFESSRGLVETSYRRIPERLYDEPDEFAEWALSAFEVAVRARQKPKRTKKAARKK